MPDTASQVMAPNGTPVPPSEPTREYLSGRSFGFGYQTFNSLANHAQTVSAYLGDELYDEMLLDSTVRSSTNTLKSTILSEQWELQSAVGPENFDEEIGRKVARQNAVQKIWPLMGYELRSKLAAQAAHDDDFPLGKACDLSGEGTCEACQ